MNKLIAGKSLDEWLTDYPQIKDILKYKEICWLNPDYKTYLNTKQKKLTKKINEAEARLLRFAPFIKKVFPETENGIIESPLKQVKNMKNFLEQYFSQKIKGNIYLKCDYKLPVAGSIKARGGIYEVLKHAEKLALENNIIKKNDDYSGLADKECKKFFSQYSIAVGSTGNLGLSIGIMGSKLGFKVTVHMSADAKRWKKDLLKSKGVIVKEYDTDYSEAVEQGRKEAANKKRLYFIDDENSLDLFLGYAVAAKRIKSQLKRNNIIVDKNNPLFVYLPCGVGGGPGGINLGLKSIFAKNVHCFFVEPTHAPSMLLGLITGKHNRISVKDFGIDNITEADGLAVGKPSGFIGKKFGNLINGIFTINDKNLFVFLKALKDRENIFMEPSAQAGFIGPVFLNKFKEKFKYNITNGTHLIWGTGGSLVPEKESNRYYQLAEKYL